jgi:hypothetical protein
MRIACLRLLDRWRRHECAPTSLGGQDGHLVRCQLCPYFGRGSGRSIAFAQPSGSGIVLRSKGRRAEHRRSSKRAPVVTAARGPISPEEASRLRRDCVGLLLRGRGDPAIRTTSRLRKSRWVTSCSGQSTTQRPSIRPWVCSGCSAISVRGYGFAQASGGFGGLRVIVGGREARLCR